MNRKERRQRRKLARKSHGGTEAGTDSDAAMQEAFAHYRAGRFSEAERIYRKILDGQPENAAVHNDRGNVLRVQGRLDEAVASFGRALAIDPDYAAAHNNLGNAQQAQGRLDEALASFSRALAINPDQAEAHNNLGTVLREQGRLDEAVASFGRALVIDPDFVAAHNNLGTTLREQGRPDDALASYDRALALSPDLAEVHHNKGIALTEQGRFDEAALSYDRALALKPDFAEVHHSKGNALTEQGRFGEAADSYERGLALKPDNAEAHFNLGNLLAKMENHDKAIARFQRALDIDPGFEVAAASLLHGLQHVCAWSEFSKLEPKVRDLTKQSIREGSKIGDTPFAHMSRCAEPSENYEIARAKSREIAERASKLKTNFPTNEAPARSSKITIGYLSADFYNHATAHLTQGLFALHDRGEFNVHAFSSGPNDESIYRKKIERDSDRFFDIRETGYAEAARRINESGVDILVDLNGHTRNTRLEICALRPSPVQVAYMGFPGTSGADFFDYILTDRIVTPESEARHYSERFVFLPNTYQVNDYTKAILTADCKRADFGLPKTGFVFCSFNGSYKIEPVMFGVWMKLLKKVPGSVLWLLRSNDLAEHNLKREADAVGVEADRLVFADMLPRDEHLTRLRLADLALDTRICGGHTTTSDALWAGVPVIAVLGTHFASRVSSSLLAAMGLPELITHNLEEYESLALRLSRNSGELAALRTKLAKNRKTEPLFDTPRFVRNLESAFHRMWDRFLTGEMPRMIEVIEEPK